MIRWGIIGTGGIASTFAADLGADSARATVGGRRLAQQGSADAFGDRFGVPNRHASYEALVADPEVDVVYVATPHPVHHDATRCSRSRPASPCWSRSRSP